MVGKNRKRLPLVVLIKVKEAIPSKNAAEAPTESQLPHVGNNPFLIGQAVSAKRNHRR